MHLPHFRHPKLIILLAILALSLLGWWAWLQLPQPLFSRLERNPGKGVPSNAGDPHLAP